VISSKHDNHQQMVGHTASDYHATIYQSVRCSIGASLSPKFEEEQPAAPEGNLEKGREGVFYLNHGDAGRRAGGWPAGVEGSIWPTGKTAT
jgi:hypothetical protein